MSTPSRKWTCLVQNALADGVLSAEAVANMCLDYMSEDDVEDMLRANDLKTILDPTADDDIEPPDEDDWLAIEHFFGDGTACRDS